MTLHRSGYHGLPSQSGISPMESSSLPEHEHEEREAVLRRSRVMWVIVSTVGLAMLGLMAVGVYREPSASRVRQYGTTTTLEVKSPRTPNFAEMTHARPRADPRASQKAASSSQKEAIAYTAEALADEVTSLPGLTQAISFRHFSGYLPISKTKNIFYWFTESELNPSTAPLVMWTNGGPGCSGLFGFFVENGPFRPTKDGEALSLNKYAWNKLANMLFIEAPVGVGFSYSTDPEKDYVMGDSQTAADNYALLQKFLERFPHLRPNDLHLASESYGGHYLPTLAKYILDKKADATTDAASKLNLKGFMVGNPYTDPVENVVGMYEAFWGHQMVPEDLYQEWNKQCGSKLDAATFETPTCRQLQNAMWYLIGDVNPYGLDYPVCHEEVTSKKRSHKNRPAQPPAAAVEGESLALVAGRNQRHWLLSHILTRFITQPTALPSYNSLNHGNDYEMCGESYAISYMNRDDVKAAIHADPSITWFDCSNAIAYQSENKNDYMEAYYKFFIEEDKTLRILVFSGDDDSVCATRGTQLWIERLNWTPVEDWTSWEVDEQVAGYKKKYENDFTFVTVRAAGHEVPAYKPVAALQLFSDYLNNSL